MLTRSPKATVLMLVATVVLLGCLAAAGYALGRTVAPTQQEAATAQKEAFSDARAQAREDSFAKSRESGRTNGEKKGRAEGWRDGKSEGSSDGEAAVSEQDAEAAASEPPPSADSSDYALDTAGPAPQGMYCPPPFQYHMGICKISRPALPEECPPGQVPAGVTGACGPGRP